MKIVYHGPIRYGDSYSISGRNLLFHLEKNGHDIYCPTQYYNPQWDSVPTSVDVEISDAIDRWRKKMPNGDYITLQHCVPNSFIYDPYSIVNIGYTTFETTRIPTEWLLPCAAMDEIWAMTNWSAKVFHSTGLHKKKISVVPQGFDPDVMNPDQKAMKLDEICDGKIVFGCCFDWTPRKNGEQIVASFLKAFAGIEDVVLVLKCFFKFSRGNQAGFFREKIAEIRRLVAVTNGPQIVVMPEFIADDQMGSFYAALDWQISCPHGEGFNRPVLEGMACGVPSIVTMWSGHMDFCNQYNSLLVADCPIGPVQEEQIQMCGSYYKESGWAYPSMAQMIDNFRYAYNIKKNEPAIYANICANAIGVAKNYTWANIGKHASRRIMEIVNERS